MQRISPAQSTVPTSATSTRVVARVNGQPLHADEVRFWLPRELRTKPFDELSEGERSSAVQVAIDRRLVLATLAKQNRLASDQDVEQELRELREKLGRRDSTLEALLSQWAISLASYQNVVRWQLSWKRYLDYAITDQNLERYFEQHRRDFDGTKLRVAHILWQPSAKNSIDELIQEAAQVKAILLAGGQTFGEAAKKYSQAPTADKGGEIGWISRDEPMSEAFSKSAFQLAANQMSEPVVTEFGVHLIRCLEVEPGAMPWQASRAKLIDAARAYLFRWLAERERPGAEITLLTE